MAKEGHQIIIETDATGKELYETTLTNVDISVRTLDVLAIRIKQLNAIKALAKHAPLEETDILSSLYDLVSVGSLLQISRMDLGVIVNNLYLTKGAPSSLFFIKQGYLVLHETLEAYKSKGEKLKTLVQRAGGQYIDDYKKCTELLREFKKGGREKEIKTIRNKIAGHIDTDFLIWHDTISSLDAEKLALIIIQFMRATNKLTELCLGLLNHFGQIQKLQTDESLKKLTNILNKIDKLTSDYNGRHPDSQVNFDTNVFRDLLNR